MYPQSYVTRIGRLILIVFTVATPSFAQVNFSGTWKFDKSRSSPESDPAKYPGTVVRVITQSATNFTYVDTYSKPGTSDWSSKEMFRLDKKEVETDGTGTSTKSVTWSSDKKTLTLTLVSTYVEKGIKKELMIADAHSLSSDGKTLTVNRLFKNPVTGETRTTFVYRKK